MHKKREKNAMRRKVNRADIGGKSGNKVKDCHVTIIRSLLSQIKENSLRVLLTYNTPFKHVFLDFMQQKRLQTV